PRVHRPRSARPWTDRFADPRHDALLGELQRGTHQRMVVVVDRADRDHPGRVPRAVLPHGGPGRDRESSAPEGDLTTDVLTVRDLTVHYDTPLGAVRATDRISFGLRAGERLGFAGESGSGKSTMALAILRMIQPPGRIDGGEVRLDGVDLLSLGDEEMRRGRPARIAPIAQGAMNSVNPVMRIKDQILDSSRDHEVRMSTRDRDARVRELLESVGLRPEVAKMFPHELSGGMKQRACIAIAISLRPRVIIADEPTSALD